MRPAEEAMKLSVHMGAPDTGQSYTLRFYVVERNVQPLLGLPDCLHMHLLTRGKEIHQLCLKEEPHFSQQIFADYADLFKDEVGKLPVTYTMKLGPEAQPVITPARRIPIAMRGKVKAELDRMTSLGVLGPVSEPSKWVSSMVATHKKKSDEIRICIDPRELNKVLKRPHHPMRTVEEVAAQMPHSTVFSTLDAKNSFWQIPLAKFRLNEISYVGHIFTSNGLKPDPSKTKAINEMPVPENVTALQRFLGMVNYMARFIPNFSKMSAPLRQLTHKDSEWCWFEQHQDAFDALKKSLANPPTLKYYNIHKPVTITCDASQYGLGAACLKEGVPIAYASRTLTQTGMRYAQIEKELLAVVFACSKFNNYIYGKHILIETDHQTLVTILSKPIHTAPARLQRMMLRLQKYTFQLNYKKGKHMYLADTLSRAPMKTTEQHSNEEADFEVMSVQHISSSRLEELREHTAKDKDLQVLCNIIKQGWPKRDVNLPANVRHYFTYGDELTVEDSIVMKGPKAVIPDSLQRDYITILHRGHPGAEATKRRARSIVFWPSMAKDIERETLSCSICNSTKPHQQKEPLKLHPVPDLPWSTVATDIFEWNGQHYLVLVDSYSRWFEIELLHNMTSTTVITKLKRHFSVHGSPHKLISDNGAQFTSQRFKEFASTWDFVHVTSSPEFPQANGLAERAVRSAKQLMEKSKRDGTDVFLNLLNIRNVPRDTTLGSPAERLMSRQTHTTLPICKSLLVPTVKSNDAVEAQLTRKRQSQKLWCDKASKPLKLLSEGQVVRMQTQNEHDIMATVKQVCDEPRFYIVQSGGQDYRRNRRHLLPVLEPPPSLVDDSEQTAATRQASERQWQGEHSVSSENAGEIIGDRATAQRPVLSPQKPADNSYVTRAGRICKPNLRYMQ
ncbi:hypothetical protein SKAU_G00063940 [Synaphobranchus kaupii]|uniref:Gypsy retrotransposon integrase-like protein 1 n=1 Tax=Synaphobranchus kaupii TaxID=118154 RepID=A0A9Q1G5F4_SYNKA|nr:hypothetical protein SKAU_G00063940 [Synaphobranchus kaupii]